MRDLFRNNRVKAALRCSSKLSRRSEMKREQFTTPVTVVPLEIRGVAKTRGHLTKHSRPIIFRVVVLHLPIAERRSQVAVRLVFLRTQSRSATRRVIEHLGYPEWPNNRDRSSRGMDYSTWNPRNRTRGRQLGNYASRSHTRALTLVWRSNHLDYSLLNFGIVCAIYSRLEWTASPSILLVRKVWSR